MGRAVGADEPGAVEGEAHGQVLDRHVMHDLVVAALQEGRIDGAEGLVPFRREAGGEGHRMLLGDADIEGAPGESLLEQVEAGARRHGGGDGDDPVVVFGLLDQGLAEHLGIGRRVGLGLDLGAGHHVEFVDAVIFVRGGLGGGVALALLGHDMDQHRPADIGVPHVLQDREQMVEVMAVDRADVIEAKLLEQGAAGDIVAGDARPRG